MRKITVCLLAASALISSICYAAQKSTDAAPQKEQDKLIGLPNPNIVVVTEGKLVVNPSGNAAAYFKMENQNQEPITLVSITEADQSKLPKELTALRGTIELHTIITDDKGVSQMKQISQAVIPASGSFEFKKGADHVMIMGLKTTPKAGDKVALVLNFSDSKTQTIALEVVSAVADSKSDSKK
jgi:copper(I)-binding protein